MSNAEQPRVQVIRQCFYTVLKRRDVTQLGSPVHLLTYVRQRLPPHIRVLGDHISLADSRQVSLVLESDCTCHSAAGKHVSCHLHRWQAPQHCDQYVLIRLQTNDMLYEGPAYQAQHCALPSVTAIATLLGVNPSALPVHCIQVAFDHSTVTYPDNSLESEEEEEESEEEESESDSSQEEEEDVLDRAEREMEAYNRLKAYERTIGKNKRKRIADALRGYKRHKPACK
jgi:hypothetical protein